MKGILALIMVFTFNVSLQASDCETPLSKERFDSFYKTLKLAKSDHQKFRLITAYSSRECISVDQFLVFMELIIDRKVKLSLVQASYSLLFDQENTYKLVSDFTEQEKLAIQKVIK